ncbi:MAG TPA: PAS domain S-box protein, partial [Burkholderiales bacterium]|nr:PAS domain S-box protein [Burkholderiales bacterium]
MAEPLKILVAEDSETDAELVQRELKRGGLDFQSRRVQTEPDFRRELDEFQPDLVISDFSMPQFSGPKALAIARESRGDIPFIFISGTIGENVAVDMMKAGADDYVMKNNLARLVPALKRELREAGVRRGRRLAEEGLRESESRFRQLIEQASDGIFVTDKEGNFILVNSRYCEMLGYSRAELLQLHSEVTYPEGEREKRRQHRAEVRERKTSLYERMIRRRDGSSFPAEVNITLLDNDNVQGIVRDITERKRAQQALVESEAGLRRAQLMAKIAHVVTGPDGSFERWSDTLPQLFGVEPAQMPRSTREWLDLLHPDDREGFRATAIEAARTGMRKDVEYRLRGVDGGWSRVRQVIEPLQGQADAKGGARWFSTLQDVTEHWLAEEKIHRLTRVYAVLSGINALIVRVRDRDELFREACRIGVEAGKFKLAWLGVVDREAARVKPVAWH